MNKKILIKRTSPLKYRFMILTILMLFLLSSIVNATIIFEENFNRPNNEIIGNNWDEKITPSATSITNNYALGNTNIGGYILEHNFNNTPSYFSIELNCSETEPGDRTKINLFDGLTRAIYFSACKTAKMEYNDGSWHDVITGMVDDQNYKIEFKNINIDADTYDIYIDGVSKVISANFDNPVSNIEILQLDVGSASPNYFQKYDNICLTDSEENCNISSSSEVIEYTEQTIDFEQLTDITIQSSNYQNILSGNFEILNKTNITSSVTINTYANINNVDVTCRINIDGSYYDSTLTNSIHSHEYRSMYLSTTAFEKEAGNYTASLQCKRNSGLRATFSNGNAILHILKDLDTQEDINFLSQSMTKSITSSTYTKIGSINFTTSNNNVSESIRKNIVLDGAMQYNYDSTGTISVYASINGIKLGEYPRYGSIGSSGNVGGLRLATITSNLNISETIAIDIYAKSSTSDGEISGNFIIKEFILNNDETNTILLNDSSITSSTYSTIKSFTINNTESTENNLVVKAGIPYHSTTNPARSTFRLRLNSDNGRDIIRDVTNINQDGVVILQEVFQITNGQYTVYLEAKTDENILISGGDLTAYLSSKKEIEINSFNVTLQDNETSTWLSNFNVTLSSGTTFTSIDGIAVIIPNLPIDNLTVSSDGYITRTIYNHNNSNDLATQLQYILARMQIKSYVAPSNSVLITNYSINITSLNSSFTADYSTINGTINIAVPRNELFNTTVDAIDYALTTEIFTATYSQVFNFSIYPTNSIDISIFDLDTNLIIDDRRTNITLIGQEYLESYTTNGTISLDGLLPGVYQLNLIAPNFAENIYYFTLADRTHQELKVYLSGSCNEVTFNVLDSYQSALDGVIVTFNQQINGSWIEIGQRTTDVSGAIEMCLQEDLHMIQATKTGYETWEGALTPYNSEYSIILDILGSQVYETLFDDITFLFSPTESTLSTNLTDFSITAYSPEGKILYFGLNTTYNGTSYISNSTTSPSGGVATISLPLTEEDQHFKVTFFVKSVTGNTFVWDQNYQVYDFSISQYSLVYLFNEWEEEEGSFTVLFWVYVLLTITIGLLMLTGANKVVLITWAVLFIGVFSSPLIGAIPVAIGIIQGVVLILLAVAMGKRGML